MKPSNLAAHRTMKFSAMRFGLHASSPARCHLPRAPTKPRSKPLLCRAASEPLPPLVDQLLCSPDLEAPEGSTPHHMLRVSEAYWTAMKNPALSSKRPPEVVKRAHGTRLDTPPEFDVCIAGGTLGIFLALALQQRGHSVCVVERRLLQGRKQEWNISRSELYGLVTSGLLTQEEVDASIVTAWEEDRIGFKGGDSDLWISDVLNIGVSPLALIAAMKRRFLDAGGTLMEHTAFKSAVVRDDGTEIQLLPASGAGGDEGLTPGDVNRPCAVVANPNGSGNNGSGNGSSPSHAHRRSLTSRLLIDCMGHYSSIVKQIRAGQEPDGMVMVVGGCMTGVPSHANTSADLLYTFKDSEDDGQMFWEAFPAEGGASRTAYMFSYSDNRPERPSFTSLLDTYLRLLPEYQGVPLSQLSFKRVLFGGFPCYTRSSPLPPAFDRVLQIGDASAAQSPLSFGGFGSMVRHLSRLTRGLHQALSEDKLSQGDLGWLQPYQPSLGVSWLFQRSMSIKVGQLQLQKDKDTRHNDASKPKIDKKTGKGDGNRGLPANHINRLMRCNFAVMRLLGDKVLRPFVQDAMQLGPLAATMLCMMFKDPVAVTRVLFQVGPWMIVSWFGHFMALASYALLFRVLRPLRSVIKAYAFQRFLDALECGSASDYQYHAPLKKERTQGSVVVERDGGRGGYESEAAEEPVVNPSPSYAT